MQNFESPQETNELEIFDLEAMVKYLNQETRRKEVERVAYDLTKKAASFIRDNQFEDVVILDRSARPFATALTTYWNLAYSDQKKPNIYFINPEAFKEEKSSDELVEQFKEEHRFLFKNKDKPTFVFDLCAHEGTTLEQTITGMEKAGFSDLSIGLAFDDRPDELQRELPVDFAYAQGRDQIDCNLFGTEEFLTKKDAKLHVELVDEVAMEAEMPHMMNFYMFIMEESERLYWFNESERKKYALEQFQQAGITNEQLKSVVRRLQARSENQPQPTATNHQRAIDIRKNIKKVIENKFKQE